MNRSQDLTVTESRAKNAWDNLLEERVLPKVNENIKKSIENERIKTGVVTKFYPYLDKAEVKLDKTNIRVLCKVLHRFMGNMIDFFTPLGDEHFCNSLKEPCIIPRDPLHALVVDINDGTNDYLLLGYYYLDEIIGFNPAGMGAMKLISFGASKENYIEFSGNGLKIQTSTPLEAEVGEYEDTIKKMDYVTSEEVDEKIQENQSDNDFSYSDLLDVTQEYKQTSNQGYYLFRGDCWTINNNFESSAAITSETLTDFTVTGTFRTKNDLIGLYWNSKDIIEHPYISYGERCDYTDVTLDFDYEMSGCKDFSNGVISITIAKNNGAVYYFTMNRFINNGHVSIDFNNLTLLAGNTYINAKGESVTVSEETPVRADDIKFIMFVIVPTNYVANNTQYTIMENADFTCTISNITVRYGDICDEHVDLEPHQYRLSEGYDDFYNLNPKRVCREMRKLGYVEWLDLYIGASHYYEKSGTVGDTITIESDFNHNRTEKMVLNPEVPLNKAFSAWLDCYARELKANGTDKLILSVSMENLQCPTSWRQKDVNGNYAITGWVPSTFFYSPCNDEPVEYMKDVSKAVLDIAVDNDMQPILQMGEAWWWWNENDRPNQPPCFYDTSTKTKFEEEFDKPLPEYTTSRDKFDEEVIYWLNQQLSAYVDALRTVVKSSDYDNGLYLALFFPPSVTDVDRVPRMMRKVNFIESAYHPSKLDILQIEDYDWVIWESPHHQEAYTLGQDLGFTKDRIHYFGGFVQYPKDAIKYWRLIQDAMDEAIDKGFAEVYVWAGSQIRRDKKMIGYEKLEVVQQLLYKE